MVAEKQEAGWKPALRQRSRLEAGAPAEKLAGSRLRNEALIICWIR
jgi:hypothetical protein